MRMKKIRFIVLGLILEMMVSCAVPGKHAPVVDHSYYSSTVRAVPVTQNSSLYTVNRGDNLYRIALKFGQNYQNIMIWNNLEKADDIEVGQILKISPPVSRENLSNHVQIRNITLDSGVRIRSLGTSKQEKRIYRNARGNNSSLPRKIIVLPNKPLSDIREDELDWVWPTKNSNQHITFNQGKKGIDIFGKSGQMVVAAASGRVMYSGSGIRGYGNLTIIKHTNNLLSAYAHNKIIFVREGDTVLTGQKIAEIGNSDSNRVKLHFEIRKQGKPVDPLIFLPSLK